MERDVWHVSVKRDGIAFGFWRATIERNGRYMRTVEGATARRAISKARRWISRYASFDVEWS